MLKLRFKNNKLNAVWLVEPKVSIGSSPQSDLVINQPDIAEHHADILVKHENLTLVNVSESPGVSVNGRVVEKTAALKVNDEVSLGSAVLQIVDPKAEMQAAPKQPAKTNAGTGWALKSNHSALSNRVFPIKKETVIGRSNECDISLAAAHLSRRHVKLTVQDGLLFVKDLGSANGTYLNGKRVTEARVKRGDELRFDTLSFGVIGPVEDMDKTTIRRVEPVAAAAAGGHKKSVPEQRPRRSEAARARPDRAAQMSAGREGFGMETALDSDQPSGKGKGVWMLVLLVASVIGGAVAYSLGFLDAILK